MAVVKHTEAGSPLSELYRDLIEILDGRNSGISTAILRQLPTDQWYQSIGDNTPTEASLDRLVHNANRIKLNVESLQKKQAIT